MIVNAETQALIAKFLDNPDDVEVSFQLAHWRSLSNENENYFQQLSEIWVMSSNGAVLDEINERKSVLELNRSLPNHANQKNIVLKWIGSIAAISLLSFVSYWALSTKSETLLTRSTHNGQTDSVFLADGSKIMLAENSTLIYPKVFNKNTRTVYLNKGKAFFLIFKDHKHPFKVIMKESSVSVLGTSFNIALSNNKIDLDVKTGVVSFLPYDKGKTSFLKADEAITYFINSNRIVTRSSLNGDAWLTKNLVFVEAPLEDVCKQLSEYYHVDIKLSGDLMHDKKLNADFKSNSLHEVLQILNVTYGFKTKKIKDIIYLKIPN
ncbi:FecR family protein [Pedobacter changchengzhani]|uniref:FecR family protein n=1 Tax=Pedobacter changchengzhani TaxID=2529274 RepID=A0A4R5MQB4_9SPHI|nr:FecR family protein [Pedobacter changchengzhani]TDG38021.1 FecR family protein [Pedobacter changchengzhani]